MQSKTLPSIQAIKIANQQISNRVAESRRWRESKLKLAAIQDESKIKMIMLREQHRMEREALAEKYRFTDKIAQVIQCAMAFAIGLLLFALMSIDYENLF